MALAIFDLDNTLIAGDSDHLWGEFLVARGLVDGAHYARANDRFYAQYRAGTLDIDAFLRFALSPLREHPRDLLEELREHFVAQVIAPLMLPAARDLIAAHRGAGDTLLIITATNTFVGAPIAARFGIPHLIATEPELIEGRYTGAVAGIPAFREGKVRRLDAWLTGSGETLAGSSFYSDSHNDLPLLGRVDRPVAVDPDPQLREVAVARGWPILSLRG
ncbi:HAD family hydrolase [Candidatus Thiodictyon syntrophicum]|jgi:HAD superfamily hydrolase (TIGR01490 family)|uniref:Histidinol-phosphatase n=1 Tax=Candidatus Thiodictyon syntrophicum TaxID=1166950 RepID=A0A2K8UG25_9GAMM|nr:HAD family hydrolase [Candidatus Thiodictyon syntrophicum]AUB84514.1 phosphoserine phosphatase [Candidatus Thiodictyon syntrophicum]